MAEENGVWRTIRGRRIFIKKGEDLSSAMKRSGKFEKVSDIKREEYQYKKDKLERERQAEKSREYIGKEKTEKGQEEFNKYAELFDRTDTRENPKEYLGDTSKLEGKHIAGRKAKAREIDKVNENEKGKKFNETMEKRQAIIEKLDNDTKDLEPYDKYNLAFGKLENNAYSNATERQYWAGVIERYNNNEKIKENKIDKINENRYATNNGSGYDDNTSAYADKALDYWNKQREDTIARGGDTSWEDDSIKRWEKEKENRLYGEKTPYNSKEYAKWLSKSYNEDEEYEDTTTPKYIQDINAGRYGNMSNEEAIKNWIDGGADIIYNDDAEKLLKEWNVPVENDDAYGTYKNELAKQLLPIYESDIKRSTEAQVERFKERKGNKIPNNKYFDANSKSYLPNMTDSEVRKIAKQYGIETNGKSKDKLIGALLKMFQ